jgi:uncharacterized tellurite resistance protein B-like protein
MIKVLKALFEQQRPRENAKTQQHNLRLAAAALLVETARADFTQDAAELSKLTQLLTTSLQLGTDEVHELVAAARKRVETTTSLYDFTKVINAHCDAGQKRQLVSAMWLVAYADGNLDKYEEQLIRQVAELTYVSHSDYIQCKLAALTESTTLQGS